MSKPGAASEPKEFNQAKTPVVTMSSWYLPIVPENWKKAIALGIDGILTDDPLELRTIIRHGAGRK